MNIILKLTDLCNNHCNYCYEKETRGLEGNLTGLVVDKLLTLSSTETPLNIVYHGGEPLLYGIDNILRLTDRIRGVNKECRFSLHTNGLLLTESTLQILVENGIHVSVSKDFVQTRDTEISLDTLSKLTSIYPNLGVLTVISNRNVHNMKYIYDSMREVGVVNMSFNPVYDTLNGLDSDSHYEGYKDFYSYLITQESVHELNYAKHLSRFVGVDCNLTCSPETCRGNFMTITPKGNVYPCDRPNARMYPLGNIVNYTDLRDILSVSNYKKYYEESTALQIENCLGCEIKTFCRTGCLSDHNMVKGMLNTSICEQHHNYYRILSELVNVGGNYEEK